MPRPTCLTIIGTMPDAREFTPFDPDEVVARLTRAQGAAPAFPDALALLLARAFRLSLYKEEGRPLRFCLALSPERALLPSEEFLAEPLPATPENLRRLCVAADPAGTCLHVACDAEPPEDRKSTRLNSSH